MILLSETHCFICTNVSAIYMFGNFGLATGNPRPSIRPGYRNRTELHCTLWCLTHPVQRFVACWIVQCEYSHLEQTWAASDKVYQLLAHGRWFSPGIPASSTTKTGRHDIAEILLKVALNTKNQSINQQTWIGV